MNFEVKYLIRWGIPGWVFATWILIAAFGIADPLTDILINEKNFVKIFGLLITLLSVGVPIGYLFHQLYFSWQWHEKKGEDLLLPIKEKITDYQDKDSFDENYYYLEFYWHKLLLSAEEEKRNYIIGRYRYFLSTIHGLGSLMYSLATSMILMFFFIFAINDWKEVLGLIILIVAHVFLLISTNKNYKYYSKNLIAFQANFIEELLNDEQESKKEKENKEENKVEISQTDKSIVITINK